MMKKTALILMLAVPALANAQKIPGLHMNKEQMQQMMQHMQEMQGCMEKVDKAALHDLQASSKKLNEDMKALCAAGKRDEALAMATDFAQATAANPAIQEINKCGEGMKDIMPDIVAEVQKQHTDKDGKPRHVCDTLKPSE